ncbi:Methylamine utilisation protein MauE [Salinimicrobium catena]|uniref:Methylamine utilisation protein MauE n=2 Tax=Salinimicrobium catena TaxID=390640 RepID=A0A1H5MTG5_9FLAO|nr:Methylamine utilisation protein MauE [Salinimicrobium catena]SEE92047.1 Methylamine utilisation protein MauE [Salinimicrobium catena]
MKTFKIINRKTSRELFSFLLITLWIYAAVEKLIQLETFRIRLSQFPFISEYAELLAWLVPGVEIMIALLFFFPRLKDEAYLASFSLLLIFTVYIIAVLNLSDSIPCSCNGVLPSLSWKEHILFNGGFLILALAGLVMSPQQRKYDQ